MARHFNCVVCNVQRGTEDEKGFLEEGEDSILRKNLQVYFFLRHVIKIPPVQIENYLVLCSTGGTENMSTWIWLCGDCRCFVLKLEKIHREIERLKKEWNRLEELISFKICSLKTFKYIFNGYDVEREKDGDGDQDQQAIFNVTREVQQFVKMKQGNLPKDLDGLDLDTFKTEGNDNDDDWLVRNENDEFLPSPGQKDCEEGYNDCEDDDYDDDYKPPSSKRSKIRKIKKKANLPPPPRPSSSSSSSSDEDEGQQETKHIKMYTCSIPSCGGSQEKMDVDTFLQHWIYHNKLTSQCTKCNKMFTPGITKNAHWCVSHHDFWRSTPKSQYFKEVSPILPEITWFCPYPECVNLPFSNEDLRNQHLSVDHIHVASDPLQKLAKEAFCRICDKSNFYSKDEYKIHQCLVHHETPSRRKITKNQLKTPKSSSTSQNVKDAEEAHDENEVGGQQSLENPWKCNIETCPKRKIETMTVDQFIYHWGIHKRQKWKCTKCGRDFASGITRKSHWPIRHSKLMKSIPEETWFEQTCPVTPTIKWPCPMFPECREKFSEAEMRHTHVSVYHPEISLEQICNQCGVQFWTEDELKFHVSTVHKEIRPPKRHGTRPRGDFNCADCPLKFSTALKLQTHRIREHRKDSFKCEICGNEYKFRETLTNHMSFTHGHRGRKDRKPNICKICGKEFPWKVNLVQHLAGVHKMDSLACEICGASVPRHLLEKHLFKEHRIGNVKHWVCDVEQCGRIFYKKYDLKFHQKNTHEKWKGTAPEFQCEECGKEFHVKTYLNSHVKLHKGKQELPWQCDKCEKRFAREDYLKNHKISQHGEGQVVKRKRKIN